MKTFIVKFLDSSIPDRAVEADDFSWPDEEWGHILFYTTRDRNEEIVYTVAMERVFSIFVGTQ
jgi:hypothetical protein